MNSSFTRSRSAGPFSSHHSGPKNVASLSSAKSSSLGARAPSLTALKRCSSLVPLGKRMMGSQKDGGNSNYSVGGGGNSRACTPLRPVSGLGQGGMAAAFRRESQASPRSVKGREAAASMSRSYLMYYHFNVVPQRGFFSPCRCAVPVMATSEVFSTPHLPPEGGPTLSPSALPPPVASSSSPSSSSNAVNMPSYTPSDPISDAEDVKCNVVEELLPSRRVDNETSTTDCMKMEVVGEDAEKVSKPPPLLLSFSTAHGGRLCSTVSSLFSSPLKEVRRKKMSQEVPLHSNSSSPASFSPLKSHGMGGGKASFFTSHTKMKGNVAATKALASYRGKKYQQEVMNHNLDLSQCVNCGLHSTLWTASINGSIEVRTIASPSTLLRVIDPPPLPTRLEVSSSHSSSSSPVVSVSCMKQIGQNCVAVGDTSGRLHVYDCRSGELVKTILAHSRAVTCMSVAMMPTAGNNGHTHPSSTSRRGSSSSNHSGRSGSTSRRNKDRIGGGTHGLEGDEEREHASRGGGREKGSVMEGKPCRQQKSLPFIDEGLSFPYAIVLLTGSRDGTVGKWDGVTLECLGRLSCQSTKSTSSTRRVHAVTALIGTLSGCFAFSGMENGSIRFWNLLDNTELKMSRVERAELKRYRKTRGEGVNEKLIQASRSESMASNQSTDTMCSSFSSIGNVTPIGSKMQKTKMPLELSTSSLSSSFHPPPLHTKNREQNPGGQPPGSRSGHGFDYYYPPPISALRSTSSKGISGQQNAPFCGTPGRGQASRGDKSRSMLTSSLLSPFRKQGTTPGGRSGKGVPSSAATTTTSCTTRSSTSHTSRNTLVRKEMGRNSCPPFRNKPAPTAHDTVSSSCFSIPSFQKQGGGRGSRHGGLLSLSSMDFSSSGNAGGGGEGRGGGRRSHSYGNDSFSTPRRERQSSVSTSAKHRILPGRGLSCTPSCASKLKSSKKSKIEIPPEDCESLIRHFQTILKHYPRPSSYSFPRNLSTVNKAAQESSASVAVGSEDTANNTTPSSSSCPTAISKALKLNDQEDVDPFNFQFPLLQVHHDAVTCLEVVEDRVLVSCSRDGTANIFSLPSGRHLHCLASFYPRSQSPALTHLYYQPLTSRMYVCNEEGDIAAFNMMSDLFEMVMKPMSCEMPTPASTHHMMKQDALRRFVFFTISGNAVEPTSDVSHSWPGSSISESRAGSRRVPLFAPKTFISGVSSSLSFTCCADNSFSVIAQVDRNAFPSANKSRKQSLRRGRQGSRESSRSVDAPYRAPTLPLSGGSAMPPTSPSVGSMKELVATSGSCSRFPLTSRTAEMCVGECTEAELEAVEQLHHLQERYTRQRYRIDAVEGAGSVKNLEKKELRKTEGILSRWLMRHLGQRFFLKWERWTIRRTQGREIRIKAIKEMEDDVLCALISRYFSRWCQWYHDQVLECFQSRLVYFTKRPGTGDSYEERCLAMYAVPYPMRCSQGSHLNRFGAMNSSPSCLGFRREPLSLASGAITRQMQKVVDVLAERKNQLRRRYAYETWRHFLQQRREIEEREFHYNRFLLSSCPLSQTPAGIVLLALRNKALQPTMRDRALQLLQARSLHHARPCLVYYFSKWMQFRREVHELRLVGCDWSLQAAVVFRSSSEILSRYFLQWANFASYQVRQDQLRKECLTLKREWLTIQEIVNDSTSVEALNMEALKLETNLMELSDEREKQAGRLREAERELLQFYFQEGFQRFLQGFSTFEFPKLPFSSLDNGRSDNVAHDDEGDVSRTSFASPGSPSIHGSFSAGAEPYLHSPVKSCQNPSSYRAPLTPVFRTLGGLEDRPNITAFREEETREQIIKRKREEEDYRLKLSSIFRAFKGCVLHFGRDYVKLSSACKSVTLLAHADMEFLDLPQIAPERESWEEGKLNDLGSMPNVNRKESSPEPSLHPGLLTPPQPRWSSTSAHFVSNRPSSEGGGFGTAEFCFSTCTPHTTATLDQAYTSIAEAFESNSIHLLYALHEAARESGIDPNNKAELLGSSFVSNDLARPHSTPESGNRQAMTLQDQYPPSPSSFPPSLFSSHVGEEEEGRVDAMDINFPRKGDDGANTSTSRYKNSSSSHFGKHDEHRSFPLGLVAEVSDSQAYTSCKTRDERRQPNRNALALSSGAEGKANSWLHAPEDIPCSDKIREQKVINGKEEMNMGKNGNALLVPCPSFSTANSSLPFSTPPPFPLLRFHSLPSPFQGSPLSFSLTTSTPWSQLVSLRSRQRMAELLLTLLMLFDCISLKSDHLTFTSRGERALPLTSFCSLSTAVSLTEHAAVLFELFCPSLWHRLELLEKYFHPFTSCSLPSVEVPRDDGESMKSGCAREMTEGTASGYNFPPFIQQDSPSRVLSSPFQRYVEGDKCAGLIPAAYMIQSISLTNFDDAFPSCRGEGGDLLGSSCPSFSRGSGLPEVHSPAPSPQKKSSFSSTRNGGASSPSTCTGLHQPSAGERSMGPSTTQPLSSLYARDESKRAFTPPTSHQTLSREHVQERRRKTAPFSHMREIPPPGTGAYEISGPHARSSQGGGKGMHLSSTVGISFPAPGLEEEATGNPVSSSHLAGGDLREEGGSITLCAFPNSLNAGRSGTPLSTGSNNSGSFFIGGSVSGGTSSASHFRSVSGVFRPLTSFEVDDDRRSLLSFSSTTPRGSVKSGTNGGFQKPFLGFQVQVLRDGRSNGPALIIKDVIPTYTSVSGEELPGPAAVAGIQAGDQLLRFAHYAVTDLPAFNAIIARHVKPGAILPVVVLRKGETVCTMLKVAVRLIG